MGADQIYNANCRKAAPNLQGTFTMLHSCLQTLVIVHLSSSLGDSLLLQPNILHYGSKVQSICCHFSTWPFLLCIVELVSFVSRYGFLDAILPSTVQGSLTKRELPVSANSVLLALLYMLRQMEINMWHYLLHSLFGPPTASMIPSAAHFFVLADAVELSGVLLL